MAGRWHGYRLDTAADFQSGDIRHGQTARTHRQGRQEKADRAHHARGHQSDRAVQEDLSAPLGPETDRGPAADAGFYQRARLLAAGCGVTRLADITGLDRLGLPVWQAVRPAGRALSVHQGKGATPLAARIGALCEGIESHGAERVPEDGPFCRWEELPDFDEAIPVADFSRTREADGLDGPVQWCRAKDLQTGGPVHLPHDLVSLDFRVRGATWFDRSSNGLAVGASEADAVRVSLLELIERDAVGEWQRLTGPERRAFELDAGSIPYRWFDGWRDRLDCHGVALRVFALPALTGVPVLVTWITGREEFGDAERSYAGSAAHGDPERALFKALAEAIQSRLTQIAGTRDDIMPSEYGGEATELAVPSAPAGAALRDWDAIAPSDCSANALAVGLDRLGYRRIAVRRLDPGEVEGIAVTKVFVPGLGTGERRRRPVP